LAIPGYKRDPACRPRIGQYPRDPVRDHYGNLGIERRSLK
jgi:hypothetical protein